MSKETNTESALAGLEGLVSPEKIATLRTSTVTPAAVTVPANTAVPAASVVQPAQVVTPATAPTINPIVVNTPLGTQTYGGTPATDIPMNTFQDVQKFAKDFAGIELKEVKDFVPLFAQVKTLQEQAAQAAELQKVVDNYKSNLEALPPEVVTILDAAISNTDYRAVINNFQKKSALDYTKPFSSQDQIALANLYTGKQHTKETFEALDESSRNVLLDGVRMKFDADQKEVLNFENNNKIAIQQKQKAFSDSIDTSISKFIASNPKVDKAAIAEIKKAMQFGLSDSLFTKEKTYAPDAAEKIAMMLYGKQTIAAQAETIGDIVKKMTGAGVTQEVERILNRSDKPQTQSGAPTTNVIAQMVKEATSWLPQKQK
jgi:hypothetical protein